MADLGRGLWSEHVLEAIEAKTGEIAWSHPFRSAGAGAGLGGPGILDDSG